MSPRQFTPFEIGRRFRVIPPNAPGSADGRIDLVMASGAFGSGEHETTASCLVFLEELAELPGAGILDLGSGTGILAIAGVKLGAEAALCVDIDPAAIRTGQLNCTLNGVVDRVHHLCGDIYHVAAGSFDAVLANLHGDILLEVAEALVSRTAKHAPILLSGIAYEHNFDVRRRYQQLGCTVIKNKMLEEFTTVLLER